MLLFSFCSSAELYDYSKDHRENLLERRNVCRRPLTLINICDGRTLNLAVTPPNDPQNKAQMLSPGVEGQATKASADIVKSDKSTRIPKPWKRSITPKPSKKECNGQNKDPGASPVARQPTVLIRKKLPWLDGPQQNKPGKVPGGFESKESLAPDEPHETPPPVPEKDNTSATKRMSPSSIGGDPALRAVGSTPSLRTRPRSGDFKSLSLNSQPRPGVKPVSSKKDMRKALGVVDEGPKAVNYASSEYSATPSSERDPMPAALPRNDPSSYERLVEKRASTYQSTTNRPLNRYDLALDDQPSPHQRSRPSFEPQASPLYYEPSGRHHHRSKSCASCDQPAILREMPKAKTLPRRSVVVPPSERPLPPPPPPPTRKPTLFAIPTHLLPSSSSSSHDMSLRSPKMQAQVPQPPLPHIPTLPPPAVNPQDMRRQSQSLNRAVTGLENLMEEALSVARNAAQSGRNDEVANILDSATFALRKASTVHGQMHRGRMSHPLVLSPAVSEQDSDSEFVDADSDVSSTRSKGYSVETCTDFIHQERPVQQAAISCGPIQDWWTSA